MFGLFENKKLFGILEGVQDRKIYATSVEDMKRKAAKFIKSLSWQRDRDLVTVYNEDTGERVMQLSRFNRITDGKVVYGKWS